MHTDMLECRTSARAKGLIELHGDDEGKMLAQLTSAIDATSAMKPTFTHPYKQLLFRSGDRAMLCQFGPCLPTEWVFELASSQWRLTNRPEGICVAPGQARASQNTNR